MLPIDLKVDYTPGKCSYKFDWRTYYTTYFNEERQKTAIEESKVCCTVNVRSHDADT